MKLFPLCHLCFVLCALVLSPLLCLPTAQAASSARSQHTEVELISEVATLAPGVPFTVALRMKMDPHWHTYWKNPGDSGLATSFQWTLPEGFTAGPIQWPTPQRIDVSGLVSSAYEGEVFLLVDITPPAGLKPGQKAELRLRADWLECEEICVPGKAELALTLPVGAAARPDPRQTDRFARARMSLPRILPHPVRVEDRGTHFDLVLDLPESHAPTSAHFFAETEQTVDYAAAQNLVTTPAPARLSLAKAQNAASSPTLEGILTLHYPDGNVNYALPATPIVVSKGAGTTNPASTPLTSLLLLGFLGGMILNLMPCVFPVLGIKVMGLVNQSGEVRSRAALHGLAYTGGVVVSFWILAGVLLALREGGSQLGWGFQLQSPGFVFLLCALLLAFGLNMSGVFEIGTSLVGAGSHLPTQPSFGGSFLSGVLATVVATPCAAPFLAPALGAALALPVLPSLVLFTAIALGLALPFLILALFPTLTRFLPRPGAWMESFKQGLAFLLYGAAGYLLWVLVGQISESAQLSAIFGLVALATAVWIYGRWFIPSRPPTVQRTALVLSLLLALGGLAGGWPRAEKAGAILWEPWSPERVAELQSEGRPIYVDFTARWCATCQVNKRVVFGSDIVLEAFSTQKVATLKGDWTNQDPAITAELARWGRSAVPFNLFYLPGKSEPVPLPELLTPTIVMEVLNGADFSLPPK